MSGHEGPPAVQLTGVNVWYGSDHALKDVSMTVDGGSVLALVGPSGCGKSTLLRVLNRLVERVPGARLTGSVRIGAAEVLAKAMSLEGLRRRVGMVFQQPNPFPFSIYDNVAYGLRIRGERDPATLRAEVQDALRQAGLWDEVRGKLRRPAASLSGGQQQRLCIARALAVKPAVLLMDEPTAALDPVSTARVEELIHRLRGTYTVLIVTHNLQQAARVSDHAALLVRGQLVETGPTPELFTAPKDARTEQYLTGRLEG
jgi:phosphate transport system ATP-binding protein